MKLVQLLTITAPTALTGLSTPQVTELQQALDETGFDVQGVDGVLGPNTESAWAAFKTATNEDQPAVIGPGSIQVLQERLAAGLVPSGPVWVQRFPNSTSVDDLRAPFKTSVVNFLAALRAVDAGIQINSTLRPPQRAYLMHFAKAIAEGDIQASGAPRRPDVPIQWVHATNAASVNAAQTMVDAYGILGPVALNSQHIAGHAIDMFISWSGTPAVQDANGGQVMLAGTPGPNNRALVQVGASYGVIRGSNIPNDPEHWSIDGS
jgi:peptidoglycan hydrolase-like protein with peptidoglycan-binding domain